MKKSQLNNTSCCFTAGGIKTAILLAPLLCLGVTPRAPAAQRGDTREPELSGPCEALEVSSGNKVSFHVYAEGVQIYRWDGSAWVFVSPLAVLYADAQHNGEVGIHYAGPTWESNSGSKVVARRLAGCTPDPNSIPWLLLEAVSTSGPGVLHGTTYIQRINTAGGVAPSTPGTFVGEVTQVPYTAEYLFYRASKQ